MNDLVSLVDWKSAALFGLVLARVSGAYMGLPFVTASEVPAPVKIALLILSSAAIYPLARPFLGAPPEDLSIFVFDVIRELAIGFLMGFVLRIIFASVELAGQMMAGQLGLTYGSIVNPEFDRQEPAIVHLLHVLTVLVFLGFDGHHAFIRAVVDSFRASAAGELGSIAEMAKSVVLFGGVIFGLGLKIAAPVVGSVLLANVGLAVVARAAPQLGVFQISMGVTILVGLVVLGTAMPTALSTILDALRSIATDPAAVLGRP